MLVVAACSRATPQESAVPPARGSATPAGGPDALVTVLSTSYVVGQCPDAKTMNARAAETTMRKLVQPCDKVPGSKSDFRATLVPGGRIVLASPSGNSDEGWVPTCVLRHGLTHNVALKEPCAFDVHLEEQHPAKPSGSSSP